MLIELRAVHDGKTDARSQYDQRRCAVSSVLPCYSSPFVYHSVQVATSPLQISRSWAASYDCLAAHKRLLYQFLEKIRSSVHQFQIY